MNHPSHLTYTAGAFGDILKCHLFQRRTEQLKNMVSQLPMWKIKKKIDTNFKTKGFSEKLQDIFTEVHLCLNNLDHDQLHTSVTEHFFLDMVWDLKYKILLLSFVESLEPAQVVQVWCSSLESQSNVSGQVTIHLHMSRLRPSMT